MPENESMWKKYMIVIRDVVFIILFFATSIGWIRSAVIKNTKIEVQIEALTKAMEDNTNQLEKIKNILNEQQVLNGKIIQYMEMK